MNKTEIFADMKRIYPSFTNLHYSADSFWLLPDGTLIDVYEHDEYYETYYRSYIAENIPLKDAINFLLDLGCLRVNRNVHIGDGIISPKGVHYYIQAKGKLTITSQQKISLLSLFAMEHIEEIVVDAVISRGIYSVSFKDTHPIVVTKIEEFVKNGYTKTYSYVRYKKI